MFQNNIIRLLLSYNDPKDNYTNLSMNHQIVIHQREQQICIDSEVNLNPLINYVTITILFIFFIFLICLPCLCFDKIRQAKIQEQQNEVDVNVQIENPKVNIGNQQIAQEIQYKIPQNQNQFQKPMNKLKQDGDFDCEKKIDDDVQEIHFEHNQCEDQINKPVQDLEKDQKQQNQFGQENQSDIQNNILELDQKNFEKQDQIQFKDHLNPGNEQDILQQEESFVKVKDNSSKDQNIQQNNFNYEKNENINQQQQLDNQNYQKNNEEGIIDNEVKNKLNDDKEIFLDNSESVQQQNLQFEYDDVKKNQEPINDVNDNPQQDINQDHNIDMITKSEEQENNILGQQENQEIQENQENQENQEINQIDPNQIYQQQEQEEAQNNVCYEIINDKFYIHSFKKRQIDDEQLRLFIRDFSSVEKFQEEYNLDGPQELQFKIQIQYFIPIRGDGNCLFTSLGLQYVYYNLIDERRFNKFLILIQQSDFKQICKDVRQENDGINNQLEYSVKFDEEIILREQFLNSIQELKTIQDQQQILYAIQKQVNNQNGPFYGLLIIFMRNYFKKLLQDFYKTDEIGFIQNPDQINEITTWEFMYDETDIALKIFAAQEQILIRCYQKMNIDDKIVQISEYKDDELNEFQYKIGLAFQPGHYNAIILNN